MLFDSIVVAVFFATRISCASWVRHEKLVLSYFNIRVPNILRCEKLCERQSKCASVTFDSQERICYMHIAKAFPVDNNRGKYLHTSVGDGKKKIGDAHKCGGEQLYVPTAMGSGMCRDIQYDDIGEYLGCYKDMLTERDLPDLLDDYLTTNSKSNCVNICRTKAYKYAGLQFRYECWCGDSYEKHGLIPEDQCVYTCPGNTQEKCGGDLAANVYVTGF